MSKGRPRTAKRQRVSAAIHPAALPKADQPGFPIVGMGASAGGLDAVKVFFSAMPADTGAAFVLVQHLDPTRASLTTELVGKFTPMPVAQVTDGMPIEANHVYVIPPNKYLSIRKRALRLSPPTAPRGLRMAVDFFLHSLAEDQVDQAIGVILSGTGTDGTLGLKEIKARGGMTMVQDPSTAQHEGMPRSAIAGGSADYVLPAEQMADALLAYLQHAAVAANTMTAPPETAPDPLTPVLEVIRARTTFDFTGYKKGTLRRRIQRRMSVRHLNELPTYVDVLRNDPAEVAALFKDLLINVTAFFREPAAWRVLQQNAIRRLIAAKPPDEILRVWTPACASGEEAYSMAMAVTEELEAAGKDCRVQIFASDVDADALQTARAGIYPEGIAAHVSPHRLSRFFVKIEHTYQVTKELRDAVVFAQQSVVSDPPFSRLDVISCRNLLIYLEPALQERLISLLHFALREGGYLFLGSAEGIGPQEGLFDVVSAKWRIFRRTGPTRPDRVLFPLATTSIATAGLERMPKLTDPARLAALAQSLLLQRYAPACVIVSGAGEILYFHGRTDDYLRQPTGTPTHDLLAQTRNGLRASLRHVLHEAIRGRQRAVCPAVRMRRGKAFAVVTITVDPLTAPTTERDVLWLVTFEDEAIASAAPPADGGFPDDAALVQQLEYELNSTKDDLQQTIESLRTANEEQMAVNEELQSSNEELETSKEELQSLNEELTTANMQLGGKIEELLATNNDLDNLLTSTNIATLLLDSHLHIRRFTPAATLLFSLIQSDVGRPIADIAQKFADTALLTDARTVLQHGTAPKTEVQSHDGRWYVRQVLPYRTRANRTEGVVMTFSDVAAEALHEAQVYAESIVDTVRDPLLVLDGDLQVRSANQSFYDTFHISRGDPVGQLLYELGNREWDIPELRKRLADVLLHRRALSDYELEVTFASLGARIMRLNARAIDRGGNRQHLILLAIEDVTERIRAQEALRENEARKHAEEQVRQRQAELAHALRISTVGELASGFAHELNQPLSAIANGVEACARYVRSGKATPKKMLALLDDASGEALRAGSIVEHLRRFIEKGQPQLERTDLRDIARNVPRLLGRELLNGNIALRLHLPPEPLPVHVDRIQIEQIMVNLMQNAIEAIRDAPSDRQEIQIHVWAATHTAEVAVHDNGTGVSTDAAKRMFEPFFTTKSRGLGMGLAISRSILEAHQGRVWVKRRTDGVRGTTVRFTLPLMRPARALRRKRAT